MTTYIYFYNDDFLMWVIQNKSYANQDDDVDDGKCYK